MRICIIVDDYMPYSIKVAAKMMHELGVEFVRQGHTVTVITPDPKLSERFHLSELDGVNVCRFRSGEIKNVSKIKRAINETLLSYHAWKSCRHYLKENPHDLIIYYSPTIFWGRLVINLKKLWNASSYLILRDFFPQWVIDNGMLKASSPITKYFRFFEQINYKAADIIGIQSPKNLEWFVRTTQTGKKMEVLYNWAAIELAVMARDNKYRKQLGLEEKVIFFYGGNIGHAQDMMNIVRLAKNIRDEKNAHFVLVGQGDEVELVRSEIASDELRNMTLLPSVSQEVYQEMLSEFDIGLFSLHRDHTTHNFPGKLLGYMAYQKAILGSVNPGNDVQQVIEDAEAGFIAINGDDDAFRDNALILLKDNERRQIMGKNARKLLHDTFSVEAAVEKIVTKVAKK